MKYKDLLEYIGREEEPVSYMPGTDLESVEPSRESMIVDALIYSLIWDKDENYREAELRLTGDIKKEILSIMEDRHFKDINEAKDIYLKSFKNKKYETVGELPGVQKFVESALQRAEHYVDAREPILRAKLLPYIEFMLIAGMRAKSLVCVWLRATGYGFSVEPFLWGKGKSYGREDIIDFPYKSVSEMPKKDKEAFQKTALDVYYELISYVGFVRVIQFEKLRHTSGGILPSFEALNNTKQYPKEGLSKEELIELHRSIYEEEHEIENASGDEIYSSLFDSWETEIEHFLPILFYRYEEALYYALKYVGSEYIDYIESLDVAEDWNFLASEEGEDHKYENLMDIQ